MGYRGWRIGHWVKSEEILTPNSSLRLGKFWGREPTPQRHLLMGETPKTVMAQLSANYTMPHALFPMPYYPAFFKLSAPLVTLAFSILSPCLILLTISIPSVTFPNTA